MGDNNAGGKQAREPRLRTLQLGGELWSTYWEREASDALKLEARRERIRGLSRAENIGRIVYSLQLVGINPLDPDAVKKGNTFIRSQAAERRRLLESGTLSKENERDLLACVQEAQLYVKRREWKALVLTSREPNTGLRVSPDLMRDVMLAKSDAEVAKALEVHRAKTDARKLDANFDFKAHVISKMRQGKPKYGPKHEALFIETEVNWKTGKKTGNEFLSCMYRYDTDIEFFGRVVSLGKMVKNPNPEYEPGTFLLAPDKERKRHMMTVGFIGRPHWKWYLLPEKYIMRNEKGQLMITAVEDSMYAIRGHMMVPVTTEPLKAYQAALASNPELHGIEHLVGELESGSWLWYGLVGARGFYERGERYKYKTLHSMVETEQKGDPFKKQLRGSIDYAKLWETENSSTTSV